MFFLVKYHDMIAKAVCLLPSPLDVSETADPSRLVDIPLIKDVSVIATFLSAFSCTVHLVPQFPVLSRVCLPMTQDLMCIVHLWPISLTLRSGYPWPASPPACHIVMFSTKHAHAILVIVCSIP